MKSIENKLGDAIIHICGKVSTDFEKMGFCEARKIEFEGRFTYGEAILKVMEEMKDVKFIGHSCIKRTRTSMVKPSV